MKPESDDENASRQDENVRPPPNKTSEPPSKRPAINIDDVYLKSIPSASAYERSFMHRDLVTHVAATKTDFIITSSVDGHVKFWKKIHNKCVEFVKNFKCHVGPVNHVSINYSGTLMFTMSSDKSVKIFDVCNFDMINMFRLNYKPSAGCWIHGPSDAIAAMAIADQDTNAIHVYDAKGACEPLYTFENVHSKEICIIDYNVTFEIAISLDAGGMIEYWTGPKHDYKFPSDILEWEYKTETDLYELLKAKAWPLSIAISPNGREFVLMCSDAKVRMFQFLTGKLSKVINESWQSYVELRNETNYKMANVEFHRRLAVEKDLYQNENFLRFSNVVYDESGKFIIYPSLVGIKIVDVENDICVRTIGESESLRFLNIALCRALPTSYGISISSGERGSTSIEMEAAEHSVLGRNEPDPMIVCSAYRKNRFYLFTNNEPETTLAEGNDRDVRNERPRQEELLTAFPQETASKKLIESCVIHTTYGDVFCQLYPKECPKTVENFTTLAKQNYYNGNIFHRVIKSFIIQTGDPTGTGFGGESIWGTEFEDEFNPSLKHDRPFVLSMANCGANTNASQFFITLCPAAHLDMKHTVFGRVTKGMEVVQNINEVKTNPKNNKPLEDVSIVSIGF